MNPKISVITTVYNCENFISKSIQSISGQTFSEFEYIVVNDGSSDNTSEKIRKLSEKDRRLIIIENESNLGRVKSLNIALEKAKGKYIAIQDADDISLSERLEKQFLFLEKNQDFVLTGSDVSVIDENGRLLSLPIRPEKDLEAKFSLLFRCTFANPSIMFRKKVIDDYEIRYDENFPHAEDFRFITRISRHGKVFNLKEKLIMYRRHDNNNSTINFNILNEGSILIVKENLSELGFDVTIQQAERIRNLISSKGINREFLYNDVKLIFEIIKIFQEMNQSSRNNEVLITLKRMSGWLGKKNVISKPEYLSLYISILTYYYKEIIFTR